VFAVALQCIECGKSFDLRDHYLCDRCRGILEVQYDYAALKGKPPEQLLPAPAPGIWRYQSLLPVRSASSAVSLGEGGTPLIQAGNLGRALGHDRLYCKDETRNPSGAFKDRPISVGVSKAVELGFDTVTTASSGNGAASLSIYAARAGLRCIVFVPEKTPMAKVAHALTAGAKVVRVRGDYSNSYALAGAASARYRWMNVTTTFLNPYTFEGDKTVAYELYRQLDGGVPDWIIVPTGAGPLLYGIWKGFEELVRLGLLDKLPRMVAVQAEGCQPIVRAFENDRPVSAWEAVDTVASAIADPLRGYEKDGDLVVRTLRKSNGQAVSAGDAEILGSVRELGEREGMFVEPAAATPISALKKLLQKGLIRQNEKVVCLLTGHGLKDPQSSIRGREAPLVEPGIEGLEKLDLNS
jgi:threonine synthase